MGFINFAISRDLLYISGALSGIAIGLLLSSYKRDMRSRNLGITLSLIFFSAVIACLAISFIASSGGIFKNPAVLVITGIWIAVFALAVCFPRAAGYPLILLGGLAVTWLAVFCLRFPELPNAPGLLISHIESSPSDDAYLIQFAPAARPVNTSSVNYSDDEEDESRIIRINGKRSFLDIKITLIQIKPYFPFAGGSAHGLITEINSDEGLDFSDNSLNSPLVRFYYARSASGSPAPGIGFKKVGRKVNLDAITPGEEIHVYIDSDDGINHN